MCDPQFQEFIKVFDAMPQHIRAPQQCYRLVSDIDLENEFNSIPENLNMLSNNQNNSNDENLFVRKKRRKLPQIPVDKRPLENLWQVVSTCNNVALSEEMSNPSIKYYSQIKKSLVRQISCNLFLEIQLESDSMEGKPVSLKLYNKDPNNSGLSPDEDEAMYKLGSDSGASSAHSPTVESVDNGSAPQNGTEKLKSLQLREATHRGLYKFIPRHKDELDIEIGDPIHVTKENEDLWCEGINLRTGFKGIFPSALATDVDYSDFVTEPNSDDSLTAINFKVKKERYLLDFLGSVEVKYHKGNPILCESVRRVINAKPIDIGMPIPHPCILEISDLGLRMTDRKPIQTNCNNKVLNHDYFFALKHVTFCGYYPEDYRFFGFISKHPIENRLACHVFFGIESTRDVAEAVGRAFHRFYNRFIEMSYPIEEFYIE